MLINDTRKYCLSSLFYVSTSKIEWLEAKVYRMNSLSKFGLNKVGDSIMAYLIWSNSSFISFVHLNYESFFIISWSGLTISAKSELNLLAKLIFPSKDCIASFLCGGAMILMASILLGSIVIPYREITNPSNVPSSMAKFLFFGLNEISYRRHRSNIAFVCGTWSYHFLEYTIIS